MGIDDGRENTLLSQWQPVALITAARTLPLPDFLLQCGSAFLLLVVLEPGDREVANGLSGGEGTEALPFRTATRDKHTMPLVPKGNEGQASQFSEPTSARLSLSLAGKPCFVVPVRKHGHGSFLEHVSIGRTRNHDIVLRHSSVSKFHAVLELTTDVRLFVKDSDSSNGTYLNGARVHEAREVQPGDTLRFGGVEARLCTSHGFWQLVRR